MQDVFNPASHRDFAYRQLTQRRLMKNQRPPLNIPVPPEPILEQAVGFQNDRNVRYLALWWEPAGDEAMLSDGFVTFTGHWPGYMAFIHHKSI